MIGQVILKSIRSISWAQVDVLTETNLHIYDAEMPDKLYSLIARVRLRESQVAILYYKKRDHHISLGKDQRFLSYADPELIPKILALIDSSRHANPCRFQIEGMKYGKSSL